jgi:hypothetical protein
LDHVKESDHGREICCTLSHIKPQYAFLKDRSAQLIYRQTRNKSQTGNPLINFFRQQHMNSVHLGKGIRLDWSQLLRYQKWAFSPIVHLVGGKLKSIVVHGTTFSQSPNEMFFSALTSISIQRVWTLEEASIPLFLTSRYLISSIWDLLFPSTKGMYIGGPMPHVEMKIVAAHDDLAKQRQGTLWIRLANGNGVPSKCQVSNTVDVKFMSLFQPNCIEREDGWIPLPMEAKILDPGAVIITKKSF